MQLNVAQKLFQKLRPKLGPYVAEQVVRNCVAYTRHQWRQPTERHLDEILALSCLDAVTLGFIWVETPQGFEFWHNAIRDA